MIGFTRMPGVIVSISRNELPCCGGPRCWSAPGRRCDREVRLRRPDLGAVHHVVVAVAYRAGLKARQVRAGSWLRITLTPVVFAGQHLRQVTGFCASVRTRKCRREQVRPVQHARRAGARALLAENEQLRRRPAGAAVLRRPVHRAPAAAVEFLLPDPGDRAVDEHAGAAAARLRGGR